MFVWDTPAPTTNATAPFVSGMPDERQWRSILLVSSPYHMRRAALVWRKFRPDVGVIPVPVPMSQFYAHDRGASLEQIRGVLHEYVSILYYWWKGWI